MEKYLYEDLYLLEEMHWWHISKRRLVNELISHYIDFPKPNILDIGCGTGKNIEMLSKIGNVWGIDSSKEAIKFCKKRGLKNVRIGESSNTGFKSSFFDVITLLDVLEHVEKQDQTLQEIRRILKSEGVLIITVPAFNWLWTKWDEVLHHKRRYTEQALQEVLERSNYNIIKISYMFSFLVLPALIIRSIKSIFYNSYYPSDFKSSSPLLNNIFLKVADFERFFVKINKLPFGTSLICVAKK